MHWTEWPRRDHHSGDGYLYVIEFSTGVVKVGQTTDPRRRVDQLRRAAAQFGVSLTRWWLSPRRADQAAAEVELLAACRKLGEPCATEFFRADFFAVVAAAQAIPVRTGPTTPRPLSHAEQQTAAKRNEARRLRALGYSISDIVAEMKISRGSAHTYVRTDR